MPADIAGLYNGAQGRNRTTDTRIFSPLLYQLSYLGIFLGAALTVWLLLLWLLLLLLLLCSSTGVNGVTAKGAY